VMDIQIGRGFVQENHVGSWASALAMNILFRSPPESSSMAGRRKRAFLSTHRLLAIWRSFSPSNNRW